MKKKKKLTPKQLLSISQTQRALLRFALGDAIRGVDAATERLKAVMAEAVQAIQKDSRK